MDLLFDVLSGIGPLLRRRVREAATLAVAVLAVVVIRYPTPPMLAPARWLGCAWYVHAVEGEQKVLDRVHEAVDPGSVQLHPQATGPEPWC